MKSKTYFLHVIVALLFSFGHSYSQVSPCGTPSGLYANLITSNSAMLNWNAVSGAFVYNVRYRTSPAPNNTWQMVTTANNNISLAGLAANTIYEYQVQAGCSASGGVVLLGAFSPSSFFTTLNGSNTCNVPSGLTATNITATSAKIQWNNTGASSYRLRYRPSGTSTWTIKNTTNLFKDLTGLISNTTYQWQVRSVCANPSGGVVYSAFSPLASFTTLGVNACPVPTGLNASFASLSGVLLSWNSTGAVSYNIRYKSSNTAAWTLTTSNTNSKILSGLSSGVSYEWQVQSVCASPAGVVLLSAWSVSSFFVYPSPLQIVPNPASDKFKLSFEESLSEEVTVTIRDLYGISYVQSKHNVIAGIHELEVNTSKLKNGIYYVEMTSNRGTNIQKFYVQH